VETGVYDLPRRTAYRLVLKGGLLRSAGELVTTKLYNVHIWYLHNNVYVTEPHDEKVPSAPRMHARGTADTISFYSVSGNNGARRDSERSTAADNLLAISVHAFKQANPRSLPTLYSSGLVSLTCRKHWSL
jgi:hypothetical protein